MKKEYDFSKGKRGAAVSLQRDKFATLCAKNWSRTQKACNRAVASRCGLGNLRFRFAPRPLQWIPEHRG